jgi:hypothetical protein
MHLISPGCIADRDFTSGVSVLDNIIEAIHSSYKVIIVLTDQFVSSQWWKYEADQAIHGINLFVLYIIYFNYAK